MVRKRMLGNRSGKKSTSRKKGSPIKKSKHSKIAKKVGGSAKKALAKKALKAKKGVKKRRLGANEPTLSDVFETSEGSLGKDDEPY